MINIWSIRISYFLVIVPVAMSAKNLPIANFLKFFCY